jgi:hypothetical protein
LTASNRTPELADKIVEALTNGTTLRQFCRSEGIGKSSVYDWLDADPEFHARFAKARARGGHEIADECVDIADDRESDPDASSRKMRVWTRLELLKKWNPKEYGDKIQTEHSGSIAFSHEDALRELEGEG